MAFFDNTFFDSTFFDTSGLVFVYYPVLSAAGVTDITTTSVRPRVTLTF
jgi:hypothetical protein